MMVKFFFVSIAAGLLLTGCQSSANRMSECETQGISRDICYQVEQARQQGINEQAMAQAYRNAAAVDLSGNKHSHHSKS